jgi:hypothetical protein
MVNLKSKFRALFQYLFPPTESHSIDALVVMLQGYYHDFQDRLPSDPACRLDPFFEMVSVAVSPKVVPPANGKAELGGSCPEKLPAAAPAAPTAAAVAPACVPGISPFP